MKIKGLTSESVEHFAEDAFPAAPRAVDRGGLPAINCAVPVDQVVRAGAAKCVSALCCHHVPAIIVADHLLKADFADDRAGLNAGSQGLVRLLCSDQIHLHRSFSLLALGLRLVELQLLGLHLLRVLCHRGY